MTVLLKNMMQGQTKGHGGGPRRTLKEMAEELGVSIGTLQNISRYHGGPEPVLRQRSRHISSASWYDPKVVRAWWATVPEEVKHPKPK